MTNERCSEERGVLGQFLTLAESVASSRIEFVWATPNAYLRALAGAKASAGATAIVNSARALHHLVDATSSGEISLAGILSAHAELMRDDIGERDYAGRFRDMQNWIGGSDYTPRGAVHVPPPPELVEGYMADLEVFLNRDDLPPITQAAIAHAQFESIHPFTDGNGRISRALMQAVLRRRELTTEIVIPVSAALAANREGYFGVLNRYRAGELEPFVLNTAIGIQMSCIEVRASAAVFDALKVRGAELAATENSGVTATIIGLFENCPVLSEDDVEQHFPSQSLAQVNDTLARLGAAGIIRHGTTRKRNKIWALSLAIDELDDLGERIARRTEAGWM